MRLTAHDAALLDGQHGEAAAFAMKLLVSYARAQGAEDFVSITSAHIDGCLYHGPSSLDFARKLVELHGAVRVPSTLNVAALDTLHPEVHRGDPGLKDEQKELTELYTRLGCLPTLTCAPYQRLTRPQQGDHIAWAESNAIVFANSVLGARTDRYGDFTDICAALTGRVPYAGLHVETNRKPRCVVDAPPIETSGLPPETYFACLGFIIGRRVGGNVPYIRGLDQTAREDDLKALGASAASSGALALFHAAGLTPEADLFAGELDDLQVHSITVTDLKTALRSLCPLAPGDTIGAICLGTPHYSLAEFQVLSRALAGRRKRTHVEFYVSTSREIAALIDIDPAFGALRAFGVQLIVDTCTYLAPVVINPSSTVLTTSGKWAYYAPGNLGYRVGLASINTCIRAAETGEFRPE